MAEVPVDIDFPVWGLLPKKETGVVSFLNKYPDYDGRNTVIAIFDSGVDPAAAGLKVTSEGKTKVIERFDCSGAGDVDTSKEVSASDDGFIIGITGRKLKIPQSWNNPSGKYRVGVLYPFSIYPTKVRERIQEYRKEHLWDRQHKHSIAAATKQLQDFEASTGSRGASLSTEEKHQKEEYEAQLEVLQHLDKKYQDLGPAYDCVLYNDGNIYRACIDTSEHGDLEKGPHLGEYSVTREHAHLTPQDEMTVSINVHDKGDTLEVVGMCSAHGTHVAAIAAGYFPDEPDKNGVAPGARIVSLTIGDARLGSMETGTALVRACLKLMELSKKVPVDVVNMSYGEHAHFANKGRVGEMITNVVSSYGVSWVVSAGNHGPALCTVGAPPDIHRPILIGVGAYVSPEMTAAAYSLRTRVAGGAFSWSSRGPATDGAPGVSLCAPGAAVASVARFTLRNCQLMNGTSMAAPHVAGATAIIMSGLKAKAVNYTPFSIKRYLENSATYLAGVEPWAQGCGLLNVEKAFEMLSTYRSQPEDDVTFKIQCGNNGNKGILLRPAEDDVARDLPVTLEPVFMKDDNSDLNHQTISRQIAFSVRLALTCGAAWVSAPAHLDMMNAQRPIAVRVDIPRLPPGPHHTSIQAYDVKNVEKGPLFRIPITVFQPQPLPPPYILTETNVLFKPGTIKRHIVIPPADASWCVVRLKTSERELSGRFLVHLMQILPRRSCRDYESQKMLSVTHDAPAVLPHACQGGIHMEIVIAKYWANIGDMNVDYTVEFCGLRGSCGSRLVLSGAGVGPPVFLRSLTARDAAPAAALRHVEPQYRPSESKIHALTARDVIPQNRQIYALTNTYNFHIAKATDVTPIVTGISEMLYESDLESQMWMLYNSSKQLMGVGDAYPNKVKKKQLRKKKRNVIQSQKKLRSKEPKRENYNGRTLDLDLYTIYSDSDLSSDTETTIDTEALSKYSVKLEKGEYVLRLCIRHESRALLERFQEQPVVVQQRLPAPLSLEVYPDLSAALMGGKKFNTTTVHSGTLLPVFIGGVPSDKIPRAALFVGATLTGTVSWAKDELGRKVDTVPLVYLPCEAPRRSSTQHKRQEDFTVAHRDLYANWLPKLEGEKLEAAYEEMQKKFPGYLGTHIAYLNAVNPLSDQKKLPSLDSDPDATTAWCEQIIGICDKVIKEIDQDKLLAYLGMKNDLRTDANKIKQDHEKQRDYLVEALAHRGCALCRLGRADNTTIVDNVATLLKFTDLCDNKVLNYGVWHYFTMKQYGKAVKLLQKCQEDRPSQEIDERLIQAYKALGWDHIAEFSEAMMPTKYPSGYRIF